MSFSSDNSPLRVILVGHSPIESCLRRDAGIDLIRARSALDAIGELGLSDLTGDLTSVVVLAPDTVDERDLGDCIREMRRVDPHVRIVGVRAGSNGLAHSGGAADSAIGAWVTEEATGESLREQLGLQGAVQSLSPEPDLTRDLPVQRGERSTPNTPMNAPIHTPSPESEAGLGVVPSTDFLITDEGVLATLLTGGDILGPCLDHLRRRFRPQDVSFTWVQNASDAAPETAPDCVCVPVEHRSRHFAWLSGPRAGERELVQAAHWLAHWLAVREQHAQLRSAAFTDPLTGAWNRRYLDRFLPTAIDRARQRRHDVTLLLFDIDNFKHYNDTYGHPAGDEILFETVQLLNSVIRPTDRVTRIGGDEFAVVFDNPEGPRDPRSQHPASIFEIAKRFQRQINEHRFPKLGESARGSLTISGGLATFPWDASDAEALIERADRLILDSKRSGKNVICIGPGAQQALGGCGGIGGRLSPSTE